MKDLVWWGWMAGLALVIVGLITHLVLDIRKDGTGERPAPTGLWIAFVGAVILVVMLCLPASYEPL